jgi:dihydrofolate reductase
MKITTYIAISANGFISNQRGVPDWLSPEYGQGFVSICQEKRAVIMGRTTYHIIAPDHLPLGSGGTTVVLTSDTNAKSSNPTVRFENRHPNEIVTLLEEKGHSEAVIIGGSKTISAFMHAGLVDDFIMVIEPVFFGNGLLLFTKGEFESKLKLAGVAELNKNTIQVHYKVVK